MSPRDSAAEALPSLHSSAGSLSRDSHLVSSDACITHLTSALSEVTKPLSLPLPSSNGALQLCLFILELRSHLTLSPAAFSVPKIAYIDLPELNERSRMQPVLRDYLL
ncbi:hypothetical protein MHYP_G00154180 [Metynnis hypsauchen]